MAFDVSLASPNCFAQSVLIIHLGKTTSRSTH